MGMGGQHNALAVLPTGLVIVTTWALKCFIDVVRRIDYQ
jgi:hypothetical protein